MWIMRSGEKREIGRVAKKGKVGEIIYPAYNGTSGIFIISWWTFYVYV